MPELPEVETVKNGLNTFVKKLNVKKIKIYQRQLRYKIPTQFTKNILAAGKIINVSRRAKYLIFEFENTNMLNHLGMTGNWKIKPGTYKIEKHDHIEFLLSNNKRLIYNDPRRFGWIEIIRDQDEYFFNKKHGPEPLSKEFNTKYFLNALNSKTASIKPVIMDQKVVLGVGNIYACESLFLSGIHPLKAAQSLKKDEAQALVKNIKKVLRAAIKAGGSTIKDFKQAGGESGYFQNKLYVYGQKSNPCKVCNTIIENIKITGRSSFFCSNCQPY